MATPARLVIAARVASIMMVVLMTGACTFVVVVCAHFVNLIARVCTSLLVGMLGVLTMHVAGLKALVFAHRETLLVACIVAVPVTIAMRIVFASTISIVVITLHAVQPIGPVMVRKMAELASVVLLKLCAHLVLCVSLGLIQLMALIITVVQLSIVDDLEVLCKRLQHFLTKLTTRADVLRPVALVEGHITIPQRDSR
jgi:hypothetical protein